MFPSGDDPTKLPPQMQPNDNVLQSLAMQQQILSLLSAFQQQQQPPPPQTPQRLSQLGALADASSPRLSGVSTPSNFPTSAAFHPLMNSLGLRQTTAQEPRNATPTQQQQQQAARLLGISHTVDSPQSLGDLSRRRPSLMSNFAGGPSSSAANSNDRFASMMYTNAMAAAAAAAFSGGDAEKSRAQPSPIAVSTHRPPLQPQQQHVRLNLLQNQQQQQQPQVQPPTKPLPPPVEDVTDPEEEAIKRVIVERMEKIKREQVQLSSTILSTRHKAEMFRNLIASHDDQRGGAAAGEPSRNDDSDAEADEAANEEEDAEALIDKVYADNRKIAAASALPLSKIASVKDDTTSVEEAQAEARRRLDDTYESGVRLLPALINAMRLQHTRDAKTCADAQVDYAAQLSAWQRKVAKAERNLKKVTRDTRHREIFEKTFVELKKQREEKERNSRVERSRSATLTTSGAPEGVFETDAEAKARSVAIIPPPFAAKPMAPCIEDRNGIVRDALADTRKSLEAFLNDWTDTEKEIFERKIAVYSKNFAAIAAFLQAKTVRDCVLYYYLTKKRANYKLKFGRKRKKIGRQYRPPVMPQLGDIFAEEGYSAQNVGRDGVFVECLLCGARMSIFARAHAPAGGCAAGHFYDDGATFVGGLADGSSSQQDLHNQIPICAKCIGSVNKNKAANRCPLGTCGCGKRKTKPARSVPEKFHSLNVENKRFIVFRLKIPPSAAKCCNACYKRIIKEIENLLDGQLREEQEEFDRRVATFDARQKQEQQLRRQELGLVAGAAAAGGDGELLLEKRFLASLTEMAASTIQKSAAVAAANEVLSAAMKIELTTATDVDVRSKVETSQVKPTFGMSTLLSTESEVMDVDKNDRNATQIVDSPPPSKEIKLELNEAASSEIDARRNEKRHLGDVKEATCSAPGVMSRRTSTPDTPSRANFGSITQGTPLLRTPTAAPLKETNVLSFLDQQQHPQQIGRQGVSELISAQQQQQVAAAMQQYQQQQYAENKNINDFLLQQQQLFQQQRAEASGLPFSLGGLSEDALAPGFATSLLAHFGVNMQSKDAADELSRKLQQNPEILAMLQKMEQFKHPASLQLPQQQPQQSQVQQQPQRPSILAQKPQQLPSLPLGHQQLELQISSLLGQSPAGLTPQQSSVLFGGDLSGATGNDLATLFSKMPLGALSDAELMMLLIQNPSLTHQLAKSPIASQQPQPQTSSAAVDVTSSMYAGSNPLMMLRMLAEQQAAAVSSATPVNAEAKFLEQQAHRHLIQQQQQQKLLFDGRHESPKLNASSVEQANIELLKQQSLDTRQQRSPVAAGSLMRGRAATSPRISTSTSAYSSPVGVKQPIRNVGQTPSPSLYFFNNQQSPSQKASPLRIQQLTPNSRSLTTGRASIMASSERPLSNTPDGGETSATSGSPAVDHSAHDPMKRKSGLATAILPAPSPGVSVGQGDALSLAQLSIQQQYLPPRPQRIDERNSPAVSGMTTSLDVSVDADRLRTRIVSPSIISPHSQRQTPSRLDRAPSSDIVTAAAPAGTPTVIPLNAEMGLSSTMTAAVVDELTRSASVKAESNYGGGVSSSCYESLSEDEGENSIGATAGGSSGSPSSKIMCEKAKPSSFEDMSKPSEDNDDNKQETFYYNVLTLDSPKPEDEEQPLATTTDAEPSVYKLSISSDGDPPPLPPATSGSADKVGAPTIATTCIYEPLSDDDEPTEIRAA